MDVVNYTPLDQARLDAIYNPKPPRSRKMDAIFVFIGLLTTAVIVLVIYVLYNRTKAQKPLPKKVVPTITGIPTETPVPSDTPSPTPSLEPTIEPLPGDSQPGASGSGIPAPQTDSEVIPQDEIPN